MGVIALVAQAMRAFSFPSFVPTQRELVGWSERRNKRMTVLMNDVLYFSALFGGVFLGGVVVSLLFPSRRK